MDDKENTSVSTGYGVGYDIRGCWGRLTTWLGEVFGVVRTMFTKNSRLVELSLVAVGW